MYGTSCLGVLMTVNLNVRRGWTPVCRRCALLIRISQRRWVFVGSYEDLAEGSGAEMASLQENKAIFIADTTRMPGIVHAILRVIRVSRGVLGVADIQS